VQPFLKEFVMAPISLKKLVDTKLAQKKITADDAREILGKVQKDKRFDATEVKQLQRLAQLPKSRFERSNEFIPNPFDSEDGVTIKTNPKAWLEGTVQMATAKLNVKSTVDGLSVKLSGTKEFEVEDFGSHFARNLEITVHGKAAEQDGTVDFTYGNRNIFVPVKAGDTMAKIVSRIEAAVMRKEGSVSVEGFVDASKSGKQTVKIEVL
jgi:hypothetical protein